MVQTMDNVAADAVAKLENIGVVMRARGFNETADRIKAGTDDILDAIFKAMSLMGSEDIIFGDNPSPPVAFREHSEYTFAAESSVVDKSEQRFEPNIEVENDHTYVAEGTDGYGIFDTQVEHRPQSVASQDDLSTPTRALPGSVNNVTAAKQQFVSQQSVHSTTTVPTLVRVPERIQPEPSVEVGNDFEAGAVFMNGNFNLPNPLHFITSKIIEGPLFDVIISKPERKATIIFQHSIHAGFFLRRHQEAKERKGFGCYGSSYTLTPGPVIPWDDQIQRMGYPFRERRRLTFARAGLFSSNLTPDQFKADMASLVGDENVEATWVFNAGNATAIFRGTAVARGIYQYFKSEGTKSGKYTDADVTYSTDPCERRIIYKTQLLEWQISPRPQQPERSEPQRSRRSRRSRGIGQNNG